MLIDSETERVITDLERLYKLEEIYFRRWFGAEYAHLSEEHHSEAEGLKTTLLDIQEQIKLFGGKPKAGIY